jgi:hypothetical protein
MSTHQGGCHCGNIRYEVKGDVDSAMECNCSHCGKKGFLLKFVPSNLFTLLKGDEASMSEYRFNKKQIAHRFCPSCGVQTHGRGTGPDGVEMVAVNIRTLDDMPEGVPITKVDGKSV